jgi:hypothetical protein
VIDELLASLAECLCAAVCEGDNPEPCFCGVMPGENWIAEYAGDCRDKCGSAWVRLGAAYPSVTAGEADTRPHNCGASIGVDIEVGIVRCAPVPNSVGEVDPAKVLASAQQQAEDILTMWRAISCCPEVTKRDYILGQYSPVGPQGGLMGGIWTLAVTF